MRLCTDSGLQGYVLTTGGQYRAILPFLEAVLSFTKNNRDVASYGSHGAHLADNEFVLLSL